MRVELSLWQRIYLLWTFRNFRRLSTRLLNSRQRALVNALFARTRAVSHSYDPLLVIGVVENFVPPTVQTGASPASAPRQKKEASRKGGSSVRGNRAQASPGSHLFAQIRLVQAWLATTVSALSLCILSVVAWHRIQGIPGSQALNQPRLQQINPIAPLNSPHSEKPAAIAETPPPSPRRRPPPRPSLPRKLPSSRHRSPQSSKLRSRGFAFHLRPRLRTSHSPAKTAVSRPRDRRCVSSIRSIQMSALAV